ncbi:hypothetical protein JXB02_03815 [Candidatus Woesearchaeota archaeon]|nr:hypothetical protein [Candidatus Woesearchaeota archaeon]
MIDPFLLLCLLVSFVVTLLLVPWWIRHAKRVGLVGKDMHKPGAKMVAEVGGLPVMMGFLAGLLLYVGHLTFIQGVPHFNTLILGVVSTMLIITVIGILDDILGWKIGLKQWQKPLLTLFAALPMMMINAGQSVVVLPLIGPIDLGVLYPLAWVPLTIMVFSNGYNLLGGYNGLEAGMGIIMLIFLSFLSWWFGHGFVAILGLSMVASLTAFLLYNWQPAKIFPGDTLTYTVGATIAIVAILANLEKVAFILFIPFILDFVLLFRAPSFKAEAFAKVLPDGGLALPHPMPYDSTHYALLLVSKIAKKVREWQIVLALLAFECLLCLVALAYLFVF